VLEEFTIISVKPPLNPWLVTASSTQSLNQTVYQIRSVSPSAWIKNYQFKANISCFIKWRGAQAPCFWTVSQLTSQLRLLLYSMT